MYQIIHQGQPGITGTLQEIIAWANFNNMQYGRDPVQECGFANFTVVRQDGRPLTEGDVATLQQGCRHRSTSEILRAGLQVDGWGSAPEK